MSASNYVSTEETPVKLTSGRLLAGNVVWNLLGTCSPVLVAVVCLPILKRDLGTDRLGVISLAWVIIGYFGFFDLGLSRALTKLVAEKLGQKRIEEIPALVWTSLWLMAGIGITGLVVALLLSRWLVLGPLRIPADLQHEAMISFFWLSISIPFVVVTAGLRGVLEALQEFRLATAIRIPMGIFTYLGPLLVIPFSHSLIPIMATLVIGRAIACGAHFWVCLAAMPSLGTGACFHGPSVGPLARFGGWLTVTNIVAPILVSCDRFLIGTLLSVTAVAYYSVPYEVVTRLVVIPGALVGVLFPAFSATVEFDRRRLLFLYDAGLKYILIALFPLALLLIAFAPEGLHLWLGTDFAHNSTRVAQLLAAAVFMNGMAQIPYAHVQGAGRPDLTAKFHMLELPVYVVALYYLARTMGINGVAIAWFLRVTIDCLLLFAVSWRLLPENVFIVRRLPALTVAALALLGAAALITGLFTKIIFVVAVGGLSLLGAWLWLLSPAEKTALRLSFPRSKER